MITIFSINHMIFFSLYLISHWWDTATFSHCSWIYLLFSISEYDLKPLHIRKRNNHYTRHQSPDFFGIYLISHCWDTATFSCCSWIYLLFSISTYGLKPLHVREQNDRYTRCWSHEFFSIYLISHWWDTATFSCCSWIYLLFSISTYGLKPLHVREQNDCYTRCWSHEFFGIYLISHWWDTATFSCCSWIYPSFLAYKLQLQTLRCKGTKWSIYQALIIRIF